MRYGYDDLFIQRKKNNAFQEIQEAELDFFLFKGFVAQEVARALLARACGGQGVGAGARSIHSFTWYE